MSSERLTGVTGLLVTAVLCIHLAPGYLPNDNDALYADVARTIVATGEWLNLDIHGIPLSFWTSPTLPEQTARIPYIRYSNNVRYLPPPQLVATMGEELPGLWYVPEGLVEAAGLASRWSPVYRADGVVVFDTRR